MRSTTLFSTLKPLAVAAVGIFALALVQPAHATIITYTLDSYVGSGTAGAPPYGTVELNDNGGSNVTVTLTLTSVEGLVKTGAGEALMWDLFADTTPQASLTITNTDGTAFGTGATTGFTFDVNGTGLHSGGAGKWDYSILCATACSHGGSHPYLSPLSFTIDDVTLSAFVANNLGYYFGSDICTSVNTTTDKCNPKGLTGNVVATMAGVTTSVPEPATFALFAAGLAGLGFALRRRAHKI
ncbi:MAG: PEP-CTERM sorting domain-containing protein [Steroidobacteraceae bacterium]